MDYKGEVPIHGPDWIPTYLKFETIPGPRGEELVAHESYYSVNLAAPTPSDVDFVPDVFLSRIPAGSAAELDLFVTKLTQYESFQPTDTWRGRQLLVSDDEYSTGIVGTSSYCFSFQEALFKDTNVSIAGIAQTSRGGADMQSQFWDLKTYHGCRSAGRVSVQEPERGRHRPEHSGRRIRLLRVRDHAGIPDHERPVPCEPLPHRPRADLLQGSGRRRSCVLRLPRGTGSGHATPESRRC